MVLSCDYNTYVRIIVKLFCWWSVEHAISRYGESVVADFAKRTNFGIPNEINAVRFPCAPRDVQLLKPIICAAGGDLPAYIWIAAPPRGQNAPKWRAHRGLVLASVNCR